MKFQAYKLTQLSVITLKCWSVCWLTLQVNESRHGLRHCYHWVVCSQNLEQRCEMGSGSIGDRADWKMTAWEGSVVSIALVLEVLPAEAPVPA